MGNAAGSTVSGLLLLFLATAAAAGPATPGAPGVEDPLRPTEAELASCLAQGRTAYARARASLGRRPDLSGVSEREITLGKNASGAPIRAMVYAPAGAAGRLLPAILMIHGGGWVSGSHRDLADLGRKLAAAGAVVISPSYRLAPHPKHDPRGARYPAQLDDLEEAIRAISRDARALGVDPAAGLRVFGFSAGANLAAQLAATWRPTASSGWLPITRTATLAARVDLVADRDRGEDFTAYYLGVPVGQSSPHLEEASPAYRILREGPPAGPILAAHEEGDPVIPSDQACRLRRAMARWGARPRLLFLPTRNHGPSVEGTARRVLVRAMTEFFGLGEAGRAGAGR